MDYRISERAMVTSCAVGILIVMLGNRRQSLMMSAVGAAVMVLGILQALVFYKCPHCKKRFKIGSRRPNVCPYCGAKLSTRRFKPILRNAPANSRLPLGRCGHRPLRVVWENVGIAPYAQFRKWQKNPPYELVRRICCVDKIRLSLLRSSGCRTAPRASEPSRRRASHRRSERSPRR